MLKIVIASSYRGTKTSTSYEFGALFGTAIKRLFIKGKAQSMGPPPKWKGSDGNVAKQSKAQQAAAKLWVQYLKIRLIFYIYRPSQNGRPGEQEIMRSTSDSFERRNYQKAAPNGEEKIILHQDNVLYHKSRAKLDELKFELLFCSTRFFRSRSQRLLFNRLDCESQSNAWIKWRVHCPQPKRVLTSWINVLNATDALNCL